MNNPAEPYLNLLFNESPYKDFPLDNYPEQLEGWHSEHPLFEELIREHKPQLIIEVGTWLGGSALTCAELLERESCDAAIVCIDTWLGAQEFWKDISHNKRYKDLKISNGFPNVFYQFLANVIHRKQEDRIVPLPQTSAIAARLLAHHSVKAELIYIDGSHDEGDVLADLEGYWPLLKAGGVMFGDDYDEFWPGLILDVEHFGEQRGLKVERNGGFWLLRKIEADATETAKTPFQKMDVSESTALRVENALLSSRLMSLETQGNFQLGEKEKAIKSLLNELEQAYTKAAQMEHSCGYFCWERDQAREERDKMAEELEALKKQQS